MSGGVVGLIGAGAMGGALARGWGRPLLVSDADAGRARALADELGGEALGNAELGRRADVVVLAHKPAQLAEVAADVGDLPGKLLVSVLAGVELAALQDAYPSARVARTMPNVAARLRAGTTAFAGDPAARPLFEDVGTVVDLPERLFDAVTGVTGVAPAYWALFAEAQVDAAVRAGIPRPLAAELVTGAMSGSAQLLADEGHDTLKVRASVTSPGGVTARGLAALERGGVRAALQDAMDAVTG